MSDLKKLKIFTVVIFVAMIGGSVLIAKAIINKETGDFDILTGIILTGAMVGGLLISYLLSIRKKKRSDNIPEIDERTIFVLKNYFMYAFYFLIVISAIVTFVLYFLDVKTVDIELLFIYQMIIYICLGIGAIIAKKIG